MSRVYFERQLKLIFGESYYYVFYDKDLNNVRVVFMQGDDVQKKDFIPIITTYRILREVFLLTNCDDLIVTKYKNHPDYYEIILNDFFLQEEKLPRNFSLKG